MYFSLVLNLLAYVKSTCIPGIDMVIVKTTSINILNTSNPIIIKKLCMYINELLKSSDFELRCSYCYIYI